MILRLSLLPPALALLVLAACGPAPIPSRAGTDAPPAELLGQFLDDYDNRFSITPDNWIQVPHGRFHIVRWVPSERYLIAWNDSSNSHAPGRWTRIDWMPFTGMAPYAWGFCLTAYEAESDSAATETPAPDRRIPMTGCNGYPFSRMRRDSSAS